MIIGWLIALALSSLVTLASITAFEQCIILYFKQQRLLTELNSAKWLYQHFRYQLQHLARPIAANSDELCISCFDETKKVHQYRYRFKDRNLTLTKDAQQPLVLVESIQAWSIEPRGRYINFYVVFNSQQRWSWTIVINQRNNSALS